MSAVHPHTRDIQVARLAGAARARVAHGVPVPAANQGQAWAWGQKHTDDKHEPQRSNVRLGRSEDATCVKQHRPSSSPPHVRQPPDVGTAQTKANCLLQALSHAPNGLPNSKQ